MSAALVARGRVLAEGSFETDAVSGRQMLTQLETLFAECKTQAGAAAESPCGVVLGYPGIVDSASGAILSPLDKYADLTGLMLQVWAHSRLGLPLRLENDARLALLGEHSAGAARGVQDVVLVTLGTGIGGAAMLDGKLLHSQSGHAGALGGHLAIRLHGRRCACGAEGCAEAEASTAALPDICRTWPGFSRSRLALEPVLDFETLFSAVDLEDRVASEILAHCIDVWSLLTVSLIHAYGPELVLFGGAVLARGEQVLTPIRTYAYNHMWRTSRGLPRIEAAALGRQATIFGAATLFPEG